MKILLIMMFVLLGVYSWFVGCYCVASREFRENEGRHTGKLLCAAWGLFWGLWLVYGGQ